MKDYGANPQLSGGDVPEEKGLFAKLMDQMRSARSGAEAKRMEQLAMSQDDNSDPVVEELAKQNDPLYGQRDNNVLEDMDTRVALQQAIKDQNRKPSEMGSISIPEEIKKFVGGGKTAAPKTGTLEEAETAEAPIAELSKRPEEELSPDLAAAQQQRQDGMLAGMFSNIGKDFSEAQAAGTGYKANRAFGDSIQKLMGQDVSDIKEQQDFDKGGVSLDASKLELSTEEAMNDANSDVSVQARSLAKELLGQDVPANLTATQLNKLLPSIQQKASLDFKREDAKQRNLDRQLQRDQLAADKNKYTDQRGKEEERRVNENYNKFLDKRTADNPMFKKFVEKQDTFNRIGDLIDSAEKGNQASVAALGTQMARAMGEVGVLTDADVTRYLGNSSYGRKLLSWYERGMNGKIPPVQAQELREVGKMFSDVNELGVNKLYDDAAVRFSQSYPDSAPSEEERLTMAYKRLGHPKFTKETREKVKGLKGESSAPKADKAAAPKGQMVRVQAPNGQIKLIPENQVEKAIAAGGKRVK